MGPEAWALDHLWLVAGGSFLISVALHFVVTWLFKNSGNTAKKEHTQKPDTETNP